MIESATMEPALVTHQYNTANSTLIPVASRANLLDEKDYMARANVRLIADVFTEDDWK